MQVYTIYERRIPGRIDPDPVLVKEGFCWPAFFFGVLWALANGMVRSALLFAGAALALILAIALLGLGPAFGTAIWAGFALLVGHGANDLRRFELARRGWQFSGVVAAPGRDAALRRWADLNPALSAPAAPAWSG